jgi:hypothetical protein
LARQLRFRRNVAGYEQKTRVRESFAPERSTAATAAPGKDELRFVFLFALREGGYDCRAGNHGHKCESNQNVMHFDSPPGQLLEPIQASCEAKPK